MAAKVDRYACCEAGQLVGIGRQTPRLKVVPCKKTIGGARGLPVY